MFAAVLAAVVVAASPTPSLFNDDAPPERYKGDVTVTLDMGSQAKIDQTCHPAYGTPPPGATTNGCTIDHRVVIANPCKFDQREKLAHLLCHEIGHVNGWSPYHGD